MKQKTVPVLTLPTTDYDEMQSMSNRRLVCVLRTAVLAPDRSVRFSPRPPAEHDAYVVRHLPDCISVSLLLEETEIFRCEFVPPMEY